MTLFQIILLAATVFFAFKIYEHIQSLNDSQESGSEPAPRPRKKIAMFDPQTLVEEADKAYETGDLGKAKALLAEADVKAPNTPEILNKLGFVLAKEGDTARAIEHYLASLEIDAEDDMVHNAIASLYREQNAYDKAAEHYEHAIAIDDAYEITYFNYANLLVETGETERAIEMYENALAIKPDFIQARFEQDKLR